ncbi:MAG: mercuric reductase [Proteobacteria bacterium]|nr:mercuric reductase [Pseudomonadota bacterium]
MRRTELSVAPLERPASVTLLTLGGVAAAFGAASCCALPLLLSAVGLGSGWLIGIAVVAAPYRLVLLAVGAAALAGGGYALFWRARRAVCNPASLCARPAFRATMIAGLLVGLVFLYLGYAYA